MKFRLVDKILAWTPYRRIVGIKTVSFEEYGLKEAFGDEARLPELLLLESVLQLGNWLILLSSDFSQMAVTARISQVHFRGYLAPGEQLRMEVTMVRRREDGFELLGEGRVNSRTVIEGAGCLAIPVSAREYLNPEDFRVLYSEIYQPEEGMAP